MLFFRLWILFAFKIFTAPFTIPCRRRPSWQLREFWSPSANSEIVDTVMSLPTGMPRPSHFWWPVASTDTSILKEIKLENKHLKRPQLRTTESRLQLEPACRNPAYCNTRPFATEFSLREKLALIFPEFHWFSLKFMFTGKSGVECCLQW